MTNEQLLKSQLEFWRAVVAGQVQAPRAAWDGTSPSGVGKVIELERRLNRKYGIRDNR